MSTGTRTKEGVAAALRQGYVVTKDTASGRRVSEAYIHQCNADGLPSVAISLEGRNAVVRVQTARALQRFDATVDVSIRAAIGQELDPAVLQPPYVSNDSMGWYIGFVKPRDAEDVGRFLAQVVRGGVAYIKTENLREGGHEFGSDRVPDWESLANIWARFTRSECVKAAVARRYYVARSVKESNYYPYQDYCDLAGIPVVICRIHRGRAYVHVWPNRRQPKCLSRSAWDQVAEYADERAKAAGLKPGVRSHMAAGDSEFVMTGIPESIAAEVAVRAFDALHLHGCDKPKGDCE